MARAEKYSDESADGPVKYDNELWPNLFLPSYIDLTRGDQTVRFAITHRFHNNEEHKRQIQTINKELGKPIDAFLAAIKQLMTYYPMRIRGMRTKATVGKEAACKVLAKIPISSRTQTTDITGKCMFLATETLDSDEIISVVAATKLLFGDLEDSSSSSYAIGINQLIEITLMTIEEALITYIEHSHAPLKRFGAALENTMKHMTDCICALESWYELRRIKDDHTEELKALKCKADSSYKMIQHAIKTADDNSKRWKQEPLLSPEYAYEGSEWDIYFKAPDRYLIGKGTSRPSDSVRLFSTNHHPSSESTLSHTDAAHDGYASDHHELASDLTV